MKRAVFGIIFWDPVDTDSLEPNGFNSNNHTTNNPIVPLTQEEESAEEVDRTVYYFVNRTQ